MQTFDNVSELKAMKVAPHEIEEIISLAAGDEGCLKRLITRKRFGEPNAYLRGYTTLLGYKFKIDRRVYIPDVEAELMAKMFQAEAREEATVLEVGTGCGWISISTKLNRPDLKISCADIDPAALEVARENASTHGVELQCHESSYVDDCDVDEPDYIVSNLPYGGDANYTDRELEERPQMPSIALFDPDGVVKPLEGLVQSVLARGWRPVLYMETGYLEAERFEHIIPSGAEWRHIRDGEYAVIVVDMTKIT
ncbi:methyltransferase [Thalassospira sp. MA62]|nr:methyltransferase [Thalassospira sp. MA62]